MEELIKLNSLMKVELITDHDDIKGHKGNINLLIMINCIAVDHMWFFLKYYVAVL
jgi:hypothetical protein